MAQWCSQWSHNRCGLVAAARVECSMNCRLGVGRDCIVDREHTTALPSQNHSQLSCNKAVLCSRHTVRCCCRRNSLGTKDCFVTESCERFCEGSAVVCSRSTLQLLLTQVCTYLACLSCRNPPDDPPIWHHTDISRTLFLAAARRQLPIPHPLLGALLCQTRHHYTPSRYQNPPPRLPLPCSRPRADPRTTPTTPTT